MRFLTTEAEQGVCYYLLWVFSFVPFLWIVSPAYQNGSGYATHLAVFVFAPPLALLVVRVLRHLFLMRDTTRRRYARTLSLGLLLILGIIVLAYIVTQRETFADTTVPFSQTPHLQATTELVDADFTFWAARYGSVFLIGSLGLIFIKSRWIPKYGSVLTIPTYLFVITTFFRTFIDNYIGVAQGTQIFYGTCVICFLTFLFVAYTRKKTVENEETNIALISWFFISASLARDAIRLGVGVSNRC